MLDVRPGMVVIDLCAVPGKTTHIAEIMRNEEVVYAFDIDKARAKRMRELLKGQVLIA